VILFDASSGVGGFGDLTLTQVGSDTVITWGTTDSLTVEGFKPKQLDASDFAFGSAGAASLAGAGVESMAHDDIPHLF
jgi:hypothetical protein